MPEPSTIESAFHAAHRRLWGLGYRMTGVAADADELVQDAFVKALEMSQSLSGLDLERWLVRVVTNLSLDRLRRRKRRSYPGSWLPSPVETAGDDGAGIDALSSADPDASLRIERAQEVSYAFLVALESLGPRARAVLLLTDVLEYPAAEVAAMLDTTEGNVRVLHHRARRVLDARDVAAFPDDRAKQRQREALGKFVACMLQQDAAGMEALLAADVRSVTDGGGRYTALREPLTGRERVIRFHLETARRRTPVSQSEIRILNGEAALVVETAPLRPQMAPRLVLSCRVDGDGKICELTTVLAPGKLTAVLFSRD